jgi:hypothetical protein
MRIEWVPPRERFDNVLVSNEIIDGRTLPPTAMYLCPRCEVRVALHRVNIMQSDARATTLIPTTAHTVDRAAAGRGYGSLGFLDWRCPGCGLGVRVYTRTWYGGRHGDCGAELIDIAEIADE